MPGALLYLLRAKLKGLKIVLVLSTVLVNGGWKGFSIQQDAVRKGRQKALWG